MQKLATALVFALGVGLTHSSSNAQTRQLECQAEGASPFAVVVNYGNSTIKIGICGEGSYFAPAQITVEKIRGTMRCGKDYNFVLDRDTGVLSLSGPEYNGAPYFSCKVIPREPI